MHCVKNYISPLGKILLVANDDCPTGLYFSSQKYYPRLLEKDAIYRDNNILKYASKWLDMYFSGKRPDFQIPIKLDGTEFQIKVWNIILEIPYEQTISYGDIAKKLSYDRCNMSARAVGGAVGKNKIAIIVPCHRVIGAKGKITGYAAGIEKKMALLNLESADI